MAHEGQTVLERAKRRGKLLLRYVRPYMMLKSIQRLKQYDEILVEEMHSPVKVPLRKRLWALKHGFYSNRVLFYGLRKDNVKNYMPDIFHDSLHPFNDQFSWMIDDKSNLPSLLKDFPEYAPTNHYLIYDSEMIDLSGHSRDAEAYEREKLLSLLRASGNLMVKPLGRSGGEGVMRLEANEGSYFINSNKCIEQDALRRLANLDKHIVCRFERQHQYANDLYPATANTIRFVTMRDYNAHQAFIGACFHRVGTHKSIPADNFAKGGLLCSLDLETGVIGRALHKSEDHGIRFLDRHPDTGALISGTTIPRWEYVKSEVLRMANSLPFIPYMGWDIVMTNSGFKVLEINSLPTLLWQIHSPICDNPRAIEFYRHIIRKKGLTARSKWYEYTSTGKLHGGNS